MATTSLASSGDKRHAAQSSVAKKKKRAKGPSVATKPTPRPQIYDGGFVQLRDLAIAGIEGICAPQTSSLQTNEPRAAYFWKQFSLLDPDSIARVLDDVHSRPHIYYVKGEVVGLSSERTRTFRIGPVLLPFFSSVYRFSIKARLPPQISVLAAEKVDWNLLFSVATRPFEVALVSLSIDNRADLFGKWPPTRAQLKQLLESDSSCAPSREVSKPFMKLIDPAYAAAVGFSGSRSKLRASGECIPSKAGVVDAPPDERIFSICHLQQNNKDLSVHASAFQHLVLREYFAGDIYFTLCRYFSPRALIGRSNEVLVALLKCVRSFDAQKLLCKFLSLDQHSERFESGAHFVLFVKEQVGSDAVRNELLPRHLHHHHHRFKGGWPRSDSGATAEDFDSIAQWFDEVRAAFLDKIGARYSAEGALFNRRQVFHDGEMLVIEYLLERGILAAFESIEPLCSGDNTLVDAHLALAKFGITDKWSVTSLDDARLSINNQLWWHPLAAASTASTCVDAFVSLLIRIYETSFDAHTNCCLQALCNEKKATRANVRHFDKRDAELREMYEQLCASGCTSEKLHALVDRIKTLTAEAKERAIQPYEEALIEAKLGAYPAVAESVKRELQLCAAVPEDELKFWDNLTVESATRTTQGRRFSYASAWHSDFFARVEGEYHRDVFAVISTALEFPVVFFDLPQSNVGELGKPHAIGRQVEHMARRVSTFNYGPDEMHLARMMSSDSFMMASSKHNKHRILTLHQAEKLTIQEVKELLLHGFGAHRDAKCFVLWVFADMSALDLGGLSLLRRVTKPYHASIVRTVSLRRCTVYESLSTALAVMAHTAMINTSTEDVEVGSRLIYTQKDVEEIEESDNSGKRVSVQLTNALLYPSELPSRRHALWRGAVQKTYVSALNSYRELYTMMCYVTKGLVVVGNSESLRQIVDMEWDNNFTVFALDEAQNGSTPMADSIEVELDSDEEGQPITVKGRILYGPSDSVDLFTSMLICKGTGNAL